MTLLGKETWLHRVNPSLKLLVVCILCIAVLFIDNLNYMMNLSVGFLILFLLFTGYPLKFILLLVVPFCFIFISTSSAMVMFGQGETTWFKWGLVHITEESFFTGLLVGFRALIFAMMGLTFALTTKPVNLFYSLMQQAKLKPKYAYSFMAALRLITIMKEEFQTIRYAMKVRGVKKQKGLKSIFFKIKSYAVPLLSGSIRRAHRIAVAMEAKQFSDDKNRTYYYNFSYSPYDYTFILYVLVLLVISFYASTHIPYVSV